MIHFAVSSWSLDGLLTSGLPLLELPQQLKEHDIPLLELCHFHLPETTPHYLQSFHKALKDNGIKLYTLLIDMGDIASSDEAQRAIDLKDIKGWIDVAATLGAEQVRIVAGNQVATPEVTARSSKHLLELSQYAKNLGVQTSTENWQKTSENTEDLLAILEGCQNQVGLIVDIGNAEGMAKYETLAKLLLRGNSLHFKVRYQDDGSIEANDLNKVLELIQQAHFSGAITLIYDKKKDEWRGIQGLRDSLQPLA
jgi:sugar phosphate isomerase/epimerase